MPIPQGTSVPWMLKGGSDSSMRYLPSGLSGSPPAIERRSSPYSRMCSWRIDSGITHRGLTVLPRMWNLPRGVRHPSRPMPTGCVSTSSVRGSPSRPRPAPTSPSCLRPPHPLRLYDRGRRAVKRRGSHALHTLGPHLVHDTDLARLAEGVAVLAEVLLRERVDVGIGPHLRRLDDAAADPDVTVGVVRVLAREGDTGIAGEIPPLHAALGRVETDRGSVVVDPDRRDLRCAVGSDGGEVREGLLAKEILVGVEGGRHRCASFGSALYQRESTLKTTSWDEERSGTIAAVDEPVVIPIEDALDLHPFRPDEIPSVVESYLEAAREAGFREVRLIHGKGHGVQRAQVHRVLSTSPHVERFGDASPERGGWGASVVWLRPLG